MTHIIISSTTAPHPAGHGVDRLNSSPHIRRGRLKNGNPSGDFLAAPRCGAHTRCGGECRQPAMRNGRCRLHGGLSTGPRTSAGLARSRRARWKHGGRSAEVAALRRAARAQLRRMQTILTGTHISAGHGVHRSNASVSGSSVAKVNRRDAEAPRCRSRGEGSARNALSNPLRKRSSRHHSLADGIARPSMPNSASLRLCVSAVDLPAARSSVGHGVHRSDSVRPSRRERLRSSASIGGLTYARPLGMGSIA